jgi:putative ABC transport system permease protein
MGEGDVGVLGLIASLVLVAVALAISLWQRLGLEPQVLWASARALVQLLLVGAALGLVFDADASIELSWLWVVFMVGFAAVTVRNRTPEVPGVLWLSLLATGAAAAISLGTIFGLGIFPLEPRTLVPLAGMMVGNSLSNTVLAARRLVEELRDNDQEVEARLALGQPYQQAARPYVRRALRTALIPQVETTKAVGLVFLPGAMTGLILAGVDPVDAVLVQAAIMYLILGSVATTAVVIGLGLTRRLFTPDHRLVVLERPSEG